MISEKAEILKLVKQHGYAEVDPHRYKLIFDKSSKTICTFLADTTEISGHQSKRERRETEERQRRMRIERQLLT